MRSAFSNKVTECPARFSCCAAASPEGPEPTTATRLPVRTQRRFRPDPSFLEGVLDDGLFDVLDGDGRFIDAQHARGLAGGGADAAGELRKVVGGVQRADGFFPAVAVNQVVPIGNDVVEGAARVAEGNAAIHAARRLRAQLLLGEVLINFPVIVHALFHGPARGHLACGFHESGRFTHAAPLPMSIDDRARAEENPC